MAQGSEGEDGNNAVCSQITKETTNTKRQISTGTLTCPRSLPTLPFDLLPEILCMLPVKLLMQLRCLCKFFNSLVSDPKFVKKHLRSSTTRHHLMVSSRNNLGDLLLFDSTISSVFSTSNVMQTQLSFPNELKKRYGAPLRVCSSDGILCFSVNKCNGRRAVLWNPSIRTYKILPPLNKKRRGDPVSSYSFGYDHFIHEYKIVSISFFNDKSNKVCLHTLGTHFWRRIQDFPYSCCYSPRAGVFVSGTVNWLTLSDVNYSFIIVSLDLEKESYQKFLPPSLNLKKHPCTLGVLKDCLCIFASSDMFWEVWIMKEYENKESWAKLYNVPYMEDPDMCVYTKALYIFKDDHLLIDYYHLGSYELKLVVYDSKNGTLRNPKIQNINCWMDPEVYIESLISPCS